MIALSSNQAPPSVRLAPLPASRATDQLQRHAQSFPAAPSLPVTLNLLGHVIEEAVRRTIRAFDPTACQCHLLRNGIRRAEIDVVTGPLDCPRLFAEIKTSHRKPHAALKNAKRQLARARRFLKPCWDHLHTLVICIETRSVFDPGWHALAARPLAELQEAVRTPRRKRAVLRLAGRDLWKIACQDNLVPHPLHRHILSHIRRHQAAAPLTHSLAQAFEQAEQLQRQAG